jgi:hypothetical protein
LGTKADIASGELRNYEMRSFGNLVGDYYVAPKFLEAVTVGGAVSTFPRHSQYMHGTKI